MTQALAASYGKRPAQYATERRGLLTLCIFIMITCVPGFMSIFANDIFNLAVTSPAILFAWVFVFCLFGPKRMINGAILNFQKPGALQATEVDIKDFALRFALEQGLQSPQVLIVKAELTTKARLTAHMIGHDKTETPLDADSCNALLDLMTGDGDIYRLTVYSARSYKISWSEEMSSHARIAASATMNQMRKKAKSLRS